jgi:hypothetical protein
MNRRPQADLRQRQLLAGSGSRRSAWQRTLASIAFTAHTASDEGVVRWPSDLAWPAVAYPAIPAAMWVAPEQLRDDSTLKVIGSRADSGD